MGNTSENILYINDFKILKQKFQTKDSAAKKIFTMKKAPPFIRTEPSYEKNYLLHQVELEAVSGTNQKFMRGNIIFAVNIQRRS